MNALTRVNGKLLGGTLLALSVLGVGTHFLHAYQARRSSRDLLEMADRAEEAGHHARALNHLALYLSYAPNDAPARARYALGLARSAATPKAAAHALGALEDALRRDPDRGDVRRKAVELSTAAGRYADAREHLDLLRKAAPNDHDLARLSGECEAAAGDYAKAAEWFAAAARLAPADVGYHVRLAGLYRDRLTQPVEAAAVLDRLVAAHPTALAHTARARFRADAGDLGPAAADAAAALRLAPGDPDVLLTAAVVAQAQKDVPVARSYLTRLVAARPKDARPYLTLAALEAADNHPDAAADLLLKGVAMAADSAELWLAADALIDLGRRVDAGRVVGRLRGEARLGAKVHYLQARLDAAEGRWPDAIRLLESATTALGQQTEAADLAKRADLLLGRCYGEVGNPDLQLAAYRRAVQLDPGWGPARQGLAAAYLAAGRLEDALAEYRTLGLRLPAARLAAARLLVMRNLNLPEPQRRWEEVDAALADAARSDLPADEVAVLRAEALAARGRAAEARGLLVDERDKDPARPRCWTALAALASRTGGPEAGIVVLNEARTRAGDATALRVALARHWARRGGDDAAGALAALEAGLEARTPADQKELLWALADGRARTGQTAEAERLVRRLADLEPGDLRARLVLFDLALRATDNAAMRKTLDAVRRVEGPDGTLWRYGEAARLVAQARRGDRAGLADARGHLDDLGRRRPGWSRAALLRAEVDEFDGRPDAAVESYLQALELGDRQPTTVQRVVRLLYERQRYREAHAVLTRLVDRDRAPLSEDLGRLAAEVSLRTEDYDRAVELARQAVTADSPNVRDHVWLGQILAAVGRRAEAEAALEKAVTRFPALPDPWVALIQFHAQTGQPTKAEAVLRRVPAAVPAADLPFVLAQCHEALGHTAEADRHFQVALAAKPDDPVVARLVAESFLRAGQPGKAVPLLRRVLAAGGPAAPGLAQVRRNLAFAVAVGGAAEGLREGLALLDENARAGSPAGEDTRVRAVILAAHPGQRREAIRLFDEAFARRPAAPDEEFLLARLYEADRDWAQFRTRMLRLVTGPGAKPDYLAYYATHLLARKEPAEARGWVDRLEKAEPAAWRTAALKAQVLAGTGRVADAVTLLVTRAEKNPAERVAAAAALEAIGRSKPAGDVLRSVTDEKQRPAARAALAGVLARSGQPAEAVGVCEELAAAAPPEVGITAAIGVARDGRPGPAEWQRLETLVRGLADRTGRSPAAMVVLAEVVDLQGRHRDAVPLYREALARDPGNVVALNNLAWLLALDGAGAEAVGLADRAVAAAGPVGSLLDTRGVARAAAGQPAEAVADLEQAVAEGPSPVRYFHLAQARRLAKDRTAATSALLRARELGLRPESLHRLEQPGYQALLADLGLR